ncbi:MAG: DUF6359 domain-containing protein [Mangrovibacterium sp.]
MKNTFRIFAVLAVLVGFNSCIEEFGEQTYSGNVVLELSTPETVTAAAADLTVTVKLYREYTGVTTTTSVKVAEVSEDGATITTAPLSLEIGNYELTMANVIYSKVPLYVAVDDSDERAIELDVETLIPMAKNVLGNETTTYGISTVLFDPDKDKITYDYVYAYSFTETLGEDGWSKAGAEGDKVWAYSSYNGTNYASMTGNKGTASSYDEWLISPAFDFSAAEAKAIRFETAQGYSNGALLKVFAMDSADPATANKTELTFTLAPETTSGYSAFTASGDIDLSAITYTTVYFGFEYISNSGTTTFQVANFKATVDCTDGDGTDGGDETEDGDGTNANPYSCGQVINTIAQDKTSAWVKGYVVGNVVYGSPNTVVTDPSATGATDTNIAIAESADETDMTKMVLVQLSGVDSDARTNLGLVATSGAIMGKEVKLYGTLENYFSQAGLKGIQTTEQFEILEGDGTETPEETGSVLFAGSNFNDWSAFTGNLNSFGLVSAGYAVQSETGGLSGSSALHLNGTTAKNDYVFTALAGSTTLPANPTKITMYIKGTSSAKSLSCNLYYGESNTYDKVNFGTIEDASDLALTPTTGDNDYSGSIDTQGAWKKITIDISAMSGAFNTDAELSLFALKTGKESDYDLYIDNITIE